MDQTVEQQIARILNISISDNWYISDSDPGVGLYQIHYEDYVDLAEYWQLRGLILDLKTSRIVARSFGYTPTATADLIEPKGTTLKLINDLGKTETWDVSKSVWRLGFEGVLIRVFLHAGKAYFSTHHKLNIFESGSKICNSITFAEIYTQLGGPTQEELFGNAKYSPYVYFFILYSPEIALVNKDQMAKGVLVYLGNQINWIPSQTSIPAEDINIDQWTSTRVTSDLGVAKGQRLIYQPALLTLDQVNHHLKYGFYNEFSDSDIDPRLRLGEFVIIYKYPDNPTDNIQILRIQSSAYAWRSRIREYDPNLLFRWYNLADTRFINTQQQSGEIEFQSRMPVFPKHNISSIIELVLKGPLLIWPDGEISVQLIKLPEDKLYQSWAAMVMSVPLHQQREAAGLWDKYIRSRKHVVDWLFDEYRSDLKLPDDFPPQGKRIIDVARYDVNNKIRGHRGSVSESFISNVKRGIANQVFNTKGRELYRLVKYMDKCIREEQGLHLATGEFVFLTQAAK